MSSSSSEVKNSVTSIEYTIDDISSHIDEIKSNVDDIESSVQYSYHVVYKENSYIDVEFYRIDNSTGNVEKRQSGYFNNWEQYRD